MGNVGEIEGMGRRNAEVSLRLVERRREDNEDDQKIGIYILRKGNGQLAEVERQGCNLCRTNSLVFLTCQLIGSRYRSTNVSHLATHFGIRSRNITETLTFSSSPREILALSLALG